MFSSFEKRHTVLYVVAFLALRITNVKNAKPSRLVNRDFLQQADVQPHPGQLRRNAPHREMPIAMEMIVESTMDV